jgi:uncharacterized protein YgiM (DUF1202 family)
MSHSSSRRPASVTVLLAIAAGLALSACASSGTPDDKEFVFTADDAARFDQLVRASDTDATGAVLGMQLSSSSSSAAFAGTGVTLAALPPTATGAVLTAIDPALVARWNAVRAESDGNDGKDRVTVTNAFVNLRERADSDSPLIVKINQGTVLDLVELPNAAWARVRTPAGQEGYVSLQYVSLLVSSDKLDEVKKRYDGLLFVDFAFLNVRATADKTGAKLGELPGKSFVRPLSVNGQWAQVPFNGKTGFVSTQYLKAFLPPMTLRQESFNVPVLQYNASQTGAAEALGSHIKRLKADGVTLLTLKDFGAMVEKGTAVPAKSAILTVIGVTPTTIGPAASAIRTAGAEATLFIQTKDMSLSGITQQTVNALASQGFDIASAGHTGDDLRSLTDAQLDLELRQSRQLLEEAGADVQSVSYPQAGVNDRVMQHAAAAGYLFGVGGSPEKSFRRSQFLRLPSLPIATSMLPEEVSRLVIGQ